MSRIGAVASTLACAALIAAGANILSAPGGDLPTQATAPQTSKATLTTVRNYQSEATTPQTSTVTLAGARGEQRMKWLAKPGSESDAEA